MNKISAWIAAHRKLITVIVGAVATYAVNRWGTGNQWVEIGLLAATCLGVYQVPNKIVPKVKVAPKP